MKRFSSGLPVREHLKIDTKTLLEKSREQLYDIDCSEVGNPTQKGKIGSVSLVLNACDEELHTYCSQPYAVHEYGKAEQDPFPNPTLLDLLDEDQAGSMDESIADLIQRAKTETLPEVFHSRFEEMVVN